MPEQDMMQENLPMSQFQIQVEDDVLDDISRWLQTEVMKAVSDRSDLEEKVRHWDSLYNAEPNSEKKDFPWPGASNITVPVVATAVDAVVARVMNSLFGANELWVGMPKSAEWAEIAGQLGDFLNWAGENVMDMYSVVQNWILTTIKNGTGVVKLPWEQRHKRVKYMESNGQMIVEDVVMHDGPKPHVIPIDKFLFSPDALTTKDIQNCEWVGHPVYYTWKDLKELENTGVFTNVDVVEQYKRTQRNEGETAVDRQTGINPSEVEDYEIHEIWCSYNVDGEDGYPSELIVSIHVESGTVLRAVYNFYRHQERPFHVIRYMPRENSLLGIGIPEMLEDIQEEVTTLHNQRIDNATISNTTIFKRRKGSRVGHLDVYPGAIVDVEEMEDIQAMQMGNPHSSLLIEEQHTNALGEKRTGVSDYTVGRESSAIGSRATATSTLALIREGNKRFQMTIRDIRQSLSDIAHQTLMLYQQFAKEHKVIYEMFSEEKKMLIRQFLELPADLTRNNVHIDIPALSETTNKEIKQQTMMTMMQVIQQFYMSMFQAVEVAINPQAPPEIQQLAVHAAKSGSEIYERLLESFDFRDAERFKPDINSLLNLQQGLDMMQGQGASTGMEALEGEPNAQANAAGGAPVGGAPSNEDEPHMDAVQRGIEEQIIEATQGGIR